MGFQTLAGLIAFNATSLGTGNFVVASAYTASLTPEQANVIDGKVYNYYAQSPDGSQWEIGSGAYSISTHTLARTTISGTSNGDNNQVNFAITPPVVNVFPSSSPVLESDFVKYDVAQTLTSSQRLQARSNIAVALELLGTATASNSASISFTGIAGASYSELILYIDALVPITDATNIVVQLSTGSGFIAGTSYSFATFFHTNNASAEGGLGGTSGFLINHGEPVGISGNQVASFRVELHGADNINALKRANWQGGGLMQNGTIVDMTGGGQVITNAAVIDGVEISMSSGNISTATFRLYGLRNAA